MKKLVLVLLISQLLVNLNLLTILRAETSQDYWPTADWQTISPEEVQVNSTYLTQFWNYADQYLTSLNSLIIIKSGYLIFEKYYRGWDSTQAHELYSTTKSVTSALVGIAVDQGLFSVDDYVVDFFPEYSFDNLDSRKQNMTVEHLLNMRSGLDWDEWSYDYFNVNNHYNQMLNSIDWVKNVLNRPMANDPGSTFEYCGGASHLLQAIITKSTNISSLEFANQFLFEPLGIDPGPWLSSPNNVVCGAHGLDLTPRDMAKFGYLFMHNGTWDGKEIISKDWVVNSTRIKPSYIYTSSGNPIRYGYQWWVQDSTFDYYMFYTSGLYGQRIHCFPELDLIFVTTSEVSYDWNSLIESFIIPSATEFDPAKVTTPTTQLEPTSKFDSTSNGSTIGIVFPFLGILMLLISVRIVRRGN